ncbi:MAG: Fe-S cluster assembly ATPase SufC [bacterium]|nr:Fe-S cluster assembly ATPase SufC [bacterium]
MKKPLLQITNLHVQVEDKEIIKGISLDLQPGRITALMGPNGSGKSTLSYALSGHPRYKITQGSILLDGEDITDLGPDIRSQKGLFLSFQYPQSIPGVSLSNFLRAAYNAVKKEEIRVFDFQKMLREKAEQLDVPADFLKRFVNEGFSGGEKKKVEILQALVLEPKVIIMDETDSGLDVDALKLVAEGARKLLTPNSAILLITHYSHILNYLSPDVVTVLKKGEIVATGGAELAQEIEAKGFDGFGGMEQDKPKSSLISSKEKKKKSLLQVLD